MQPLRYAPKRARELLPLLQSIGREISERTEALETLESEIARSESQVLSEQDRDRLHELVAEAAAHRRGLRLARLELERLGCSVVGTSPLTFRIPGRVGLRDRSFVWRTGDRVLH